MMSSFDLLMLLVGLSAATVLYTKLPQRVRVGVVTASVLAVMLNIAAQPAFAARVDGAAAANDNALSEEQNELNETLKTTPQGNQYQGIEYPQVTGEPLSDGEITQRIKREVPDNIKVSVSSGAVRLSGAVNSRDEAQEIVQDVKEIPGIHEVSYDLGLSD